MTSNDPSLGQYFNPLRHADREQLEERLDRYRDQLEAQGYEVTIAEGEQGFFAGVLVIDDEQGRFGFLEDTGTVNWLTGDVGGIGALGAAIAQRPSETLQTQVEDAKNADIE